MLNDFNNLMIKVKKESMYQKNKLQSGINKLQETNV